MAFRSTLEDALSRLRRTPHVVLDSALLLPARESASLEALQALSKVRFPPWLAQLYSEIGGAHISWRLSPAGYEELDPGRADNGYRYDISGNLDILSPEAVMEGFTGRGWRGLHGESTQTFWPVDFASFFMHLGFNHPMEGEPDSRVLFVLYDDRQVSLGQTLTQYLQLGADLLFLKDWQLTLLGDETHAEDVGRLRAVRDLLGRR